MDVTPYYFLAKELKPALRHHEDEKEEEEAKSVCSNACGALGRFQPNISAIVCQPEEALVKAESENPSRGTPDYDGGPSYIRRRRAKLGWQPEEVLVVPGNPAKIPTDTDADADGPESTGLGT
ncbi:hypothetical protein ColTof4_09832 [Colletotrichum tofieldiae]|nr:hypothetical protein ColTof3_05189 [Colletotrichum tofieldiae]GKT77409.1 hypothetical protein ColTof4_09832 [Colletotrichum tofieldiae]